MTPAVEYSDNADMVSEWKQGKEDWNSGPLGTKIPSDAEVSETENGMKITVPSNVTYGCALSPYYKIDISRGPKVSFKIIGTTSQWAFKVHAENGNWDGYYIIKDTSDNGEFEFDIYNAMLADDRTFDLSGMQNISFWFIPTGGLGCSIEVSDLKVVYLYDCPIVTEPEKYEWGFNFTAGYLNLWSSDEEQGGDGNGYVKYTDGGCVEMGLASDKNNGAVLSKYIEVDFDKNPVIEFTPEALSGSYGIGVAFEGDSSVYMLTDNITDCSNKKISVIKCLKANYPDLIKAGTLNIKIIINLYSSGAALTLSDLKTIYSLTPWGETISGDKWNEWRSNSSSSSAAAVTNENGIFTVTNTDEKNMTTSLRGANGKFELNLDYNPSLKIIVYDASAKWSLSLLFFGKGETKIDIIPATGEKQTNITVNLLQALKSADPDFSKKGTQSVYLQINVLGGQNYVKISKLITFYSVTEISFDKGNTLVETEITSMQRDESLETKAYINNLNKAVIAENLHSSASLTTKASINSDKNPCAVLDIYSVTGSWFFITTVNGKEYAFTGKTGYETAGVYTFDICSLLKELGADISGTVTAEFTFGCSGEGSSLVLNSLRFCYSLDEISGVTVNGNIISWNAVYGADGYSLIIYDSGKNVVYTDCKYTAESFDVSDLNLTEGIYSVSLTPYGKKCLSPKAAVKGFKQGNIKSVTLDTPSGFSISGLTVNFDAVTNASGYEAELVNADTCKVITKGRVYEDNSFDLSSAGLSAYNYKLTVKAVGDGVVFLNSDEYTYLFNSPAAARFTPKSITEFQASNNGAYAELTKEGYAKLVIPNGGVWGNVKSSEFNLDFDKNPILFIDFGEVTCGYYLQISIDGVLFYIKDNTFDNKTVLMDIVKELKSRKTASESSLKGTHKVIIYYGATSDSATSPSVVIKSTRIMTISEGNIDPILGDLITPKLTIGTEKVEWEAVLHAEEYFITVKNEFGVLYSVNQAGTEVDLSFLKIAGEYTVTVYARGKNYYDSESAAAIYKISEAVSESEVNKGCKSNLKNFGFGISAIIISAIFTTIKRKKQYE